MPAQETSVSFCEFSLRRHYSRWSLDYALPAIFYVLGMITFSFLCLAVGFIIPSSAIVSITFLTTFVLSALGIISYLCFNKRIFSSRLELLDPTAFFPPKILKRLLVFDEKDSDKDFCKKNFPNSFFVPLGLHLEEQKEPEPARSQHIEKILVALHTLTDGKRNDPPPIMSIMKEVLFKDYEYLKDPIDSISFLSCSRGEAFLEAFLKFSVSYLEHHAERISAFWLNEFFSPSEHFYPTVSLVKSITKKFSEEQTEQNFLKETVLANLRLANVFLYGKVMKSLVDRNSVEEVIRKVFPKTLPADVTDFSRSGNFIGVVLSNLSQETRNSILQGNSVNDISAAKLLEVVSTKKTSLNSLTYASDDPEDLLKISKKKAWLIELLSVFNLPTGKFFLVGKVIFRIKAIINSIEKIKNNIEEFLSDPLLILEVIRENPELQEIIKVYSPLSPDVLENLASPMFSGPCYFGIASKKEVRIFLKRVHISEEDFTAAIKSNRILHLLLPKMF
ncbi:CT214 family putative inclusion membrane protein [Chlamydiifrater phoenicopteri]|uniref:CT214 family putative inclusion membrane protein n=1 Tax=Chlamydiifrater phoenicopteri TaxID=2681469 RepID=UPI001BCB760D|nr:hypothetical protein [Chlamydiifrater phoenicopteri]